MPHLISLLLTSYIATVFCHNVGSHLFSHLVSLTSDFFDDLDNVKGNSQTFCKMCSSRVV